MENTDKKHGVVAERILEKEEQKRASKAKDKETKKEIRGKIANIVDEAYDMMIDRFVEPFNGEKQDKAEREKKEADAKKKMMDAMDDAFDSLVDRMAEKMEQKEDSFGKDLETAKDTVVALAEGGDAGIGEAVHMAEKELVDGYKKIEDGTVDRFNKIADGFVGKFLLKDGETVEEARQRLAKEQEKRLEKSKAIGKNSLEKSRSYGYKKEID